MKISFRLNRTGALLVALTANYNASAELVNLHLSPDPESPVLAEADSGDPELDGAIQPGDNDLAEEGWYLVDYQGTFTGFVLASQLGSDDDILPNTSLRLEDNSSAPIITVIEEEDIILEIESEGPWRAVTLQKTIPLYFNAPEGWQPWSTAADRSSRNAANLRDEASAADAIVSSEPPKPRISRNYEGILKESKKRYFLFPKPPYPYELRDEESNRIAYLDFRGIISDNPLDRYVGNEIRLYGKLEFDQKKEVRVIRVQLIR